MHANHVISTGFVIEVKIWQGNVKLNTGHVSCRDENIWYGECKLCMKFELLQPLKLLACTYQKLYITQAALSFITIIIIIITTSKTTYYDFIYCIITIMMLVRRYFITYLSVMITLRLLTREIERVYKGGKHTIKLSSSSVRWMLGAP